MPLVRHVVNLWVGRKVRRTEDLAAARAEVAHLKPIVVVTGASRGIGAAIAMRFAQGGYDVALIARGRTDLEATAVNIARSTARTPLLLSLDITEPEGPATIEKAVLARGFYVDVLVNNAAIGLAGPFAAHNGRDLDRLLALNIQALTRLTHHFLPSMQQRGAGGILNMASLGGVVPGPGQAVYYASKAYVLSLTEALAAEGSGRGVRISALAPGPVDTRFHADMGAENSFYRLLVPALSPKRVAATAYRSFILGQRIVVPGLLNRIAYIALRLLPHPVTVPLLSWLLETRQSKK